MNFNLLTLNIKDEQSNCTAKLYQIQAEANIVVDLIFGLISKRMEIIQSSSPQA